MASNPIIAGNTVYCQDLQSNTYAIDLPTGNIIWKKDYNLNGFGPNGPAIGFGKLFVTKGHYEIVASTPRTEMSYGRQNYRIQKPLALTFS